MQVFKNLFFQISCVAELVALMYFIAHEQYAIPVFIAVKWAVVLLLFPIERLISKKSPTDN